MLQYYCIFYFAEQCLKYNFLVYLFVSITRDAWTPDFPLSRDIDIAEVLISSSFILTTNSHLPSK